MKILFENTYFGWHHSWKRKIVDRLLLLSGFFNLILERGFRGDPYGRETIMYLDNCEGHNASENFTAALAQTKTKLSNFPPCSTHLVQPCDSFVIFKIKEEWKRL